MNLFDYVCVLLSAVMITYGFNIQTDKPRSITGMCNRLFTDPHFELELIVGYQWRIFYAWNFETNMFHDICQDIRFKNATPTIINRIWNDMYEYLDTQPEWSSAILLMSMTPTHEMLLFSDKGIPGRYLGVANVMRSDRALPTKKSIPLFNVHLKLLKKGRWLVLSDCNIDVTTLSARMDVRTGFRETEVMTIANKLSIGEGVLACVAELRV